MGVFGSFKSGKISGLLDGTARTYSSGKSKTDPSSSSVCGSGALRNAIAVPVRRAPTDKTTAGCENLNPPAAARIILSRPAREISRRRVDVIDVIDVVVVVVIVIVIVIVIVVGFVGGVEYCRRGSVSQSSQSLHEREKSARTSNDVSTLFDERTNASNERTRASGTRATHGESGRRRREMDRERTLRWNERARMALARKGCHGVVEGEAGDAARWIVRR